MPNNEMLIKTYLKKLKCFKLKNYKFMVRKQWIIIRIMKNTFVYLSRI